MSPIYNDLPTIQDAFKDMSIEGINAVLIELSQLLMGYRLHTYFGIALVHRHFTLEDDEQMVDLTSGENIVTSVFKKGTPGSHVVTKFNLRIPSSVTIVASSFIVCESGLLPYEYTCLDEKQAHIGNNIINDIGSKFCSDWIDLLERFGMHNKFGLMALKADELVFRREESYNMERLSINRRDVNNIDKCIPTVWYVGDGAPKVCMGCDHCDESGLNE
jgi:hypothetical protein